MTVAARVTVPAPEADEPSGLHGPYLRIRTQSRRRVSGRMVALFLVGASLLFAKVWERTVANSLSMERDRLSSDVRSLENRIRITRDLEEQAAFREGVDLESLGKHGFQNPDPARVVDIDLSLPRARRAAAPSWGSRLLAAARRSLPPFWTERVLGLPAAPVEAGGTR